MGQAVVQIAARKLGVETINFVRDRCVPLSLSPFASPPALMPAPNFRSKDLDALRADFAQWGEGGPGTHVFTYEELADRNSGAKEAIKKLLNGRKIKLGLNALCGKDTRNMVKLLGSVVLLFHRALRKHGSRLPPLCPPSDPRQAW